MVVTNWAKQNIAYVIGNSGLSVPTFFIIGSGSGAAAITDTTLIYPTDTQSVTQTDLTEPYIVTWQGDWNSVEISGLSLKEFGMKVGSPLTGSVWSRTSMPSISFDGTNELRIEENWEVY